MQSEPTLPTKLHGEIMPAEAQRIVRAVDYVHVRKICQKLGLKFVETDDCIKILKA